MKKQTCLETRSNVELNLQSVTEYFKRQGDVTVAYLFGSAARGQMHPLSDVDMAALFEPGVDR